jgi:SHS2 domain-containing protein
MFETFEHKADVGVRGKGTTMAKAFEETAKALVEVMVDTESIDPIKSHVINLSAKDEGALLVLFLNELLFLKDTKKMIYSKFRVEIKEDKNDSGEKKVLLKAVIFGEKINQKKHEFRVDAKAATYSELKVGKEGNEWIAQCIIDV